MISVIIPVYNGEKYIDNCLRSVLSQKNADFEVILVNDGSTDRTDELCRKWRKKYANLIYFTQNNQGQGSARNYGVTHARGQWLVFLDADDEMCPDAMEAMEKAVSDNLDIVFFEFFQRRKGDMSDHPVKFTEETEDKKQMMRMMSTFLWDKMFRLDFWKQERIDLENMYGEDLKAVYLLMAKCGKFGLIRKPLIRHYEREDNLSSDPKKVMGITESIENTLQEFSERELLAAYQIPLFYMVYRQYLLYQDPKFCDFQQEQLQEIQDRLKGILQKYFGLICDCLKMMEKTELVMIGRTFEQIYEEIKKEREGFGFVFKRTSEYDELERFVTVDGKTVTENTVEGQFYLLDLSHEGRTCRFGTRSQTWQRTRWIALADEFLEKAGRRGNIKGIVIYKGSDCYTQDLMTILGKKAHVETADRTMSLLETVLTGFIQTQEICVENRQIGGKPFWCEGEQYRLQYNEAILHIWLKLKYQNKSFAVFFQRHGYKKIAIYGMGHLGERLLDELNLTDVHVVYGIEKEKKEAGRLKMYSMQEEWPQVDAIVVSVVHLFFVIKYELEQKTDIPVLSLEHILEELLCGEDKHDYIENSST